jgi:hypothetical protein
MRGWEHKLRSEGRAVSRNASAVGVGFEPTEGVNPHSLSRRARYGRFGTPPASEYTSADAPKAPAILLDGDVRERPNRRAWRARDPARGPRVQISSSPRHFLVTSPMEWGRKNLRESSGRLWSASLPL